MGLGGSGAPPLRPTPLRGDRRTRGSDDRVFPAGRRHRGPQDRVGGRLRRRPRAPADQCRGAQAAPTSDLGDPAGQGAHSLERVDRAGGEGEPRGTSETTNAPGWPDWPTATTCRCFTPADLADEILADAACVAVQTVAERRATFTRANVLAEVHRQFHGVRFASPDERIAVVERTADLALARSLLVSAPELHHTPERLRRADGTSRFRAKGHEIYTTATLLEAEARLLEAGRQVGGPAASMGIVASVTGANLPGRDIPLSIDQALAVERIATSGRSLDVLVGPAGTGKSTTMAGLRAVWEAEHGAGSVLGLAPSAAAAEVLAEELGIDTENTAKWLYEHRREAERTAQTGRAARRAGGSSPLVPATFGHASQGGPGRSRTGPLAAPRRPVGDRRRGQPGRHFRPRRARDARPELPGAKVVLVGDDRQISAVESGGMFAALVRDRDGLAPALSDVRRFAHEWEKAASVELRQGSPDAIDAYTAHGRISEGSREEMLDALYRGWKDDTEAGRTSLMIAGDLGSVSELNSRARADRITAGEVAERGLDVAGGGTAGVGDRVITRQNDRRLSTGRGWVRNGDQWTVTDTHPDGSMSVQRVNKGTGRVVLPAAYVAEHVELAYASTAHRAQGRSVDTAHAMVSPTTTREVLYVSATRGREHNRLYVDTHYDPDPQTSHDGHGRADNGSRGAGRSPAQRGGRRGGPRDDPARTGRGRRHGAALGRVPDAGHIGPSRAMGRLARPLRVDRCRAGICSGQRGARSAAGVAARGRSARSRRRGGRAPTGRPPVPGRRRRRGGGAPRPGGPLGPGGRWPAADGGQSHRRADSQGRRCHRSRDGGGVG